LASGQVASKKKPATTRTRPTPAQINGVSARRRHHSKAAAIKAAAPPHQNRFGGVQTPFSIHFSGASAV
jgi:hypothetical protein